MIIINDYDDDYVQMKMRKYTEKKIGKSKFKTENKIKKYHIHIYENSLNSTHKK